MDLITGGERAIASRKHHRAGKNSHKFWRSLLLVCSIVFWIWSATPALAADVATEGVIDLGKGEQIFSLECAGCHARGGNIIRRGKTLKRKALKRNGLDSIDSIANLVRYGKNNMSAYGDRLSDAEIRNVSAYVLDRAAANWRN
ncbi:MAG: c-type cytochrome [Cyanobacteriota bacterium]|nr:c-type cytochrome [Cyanobacteriota bacterium]